jgi:hypothetical protein
MMSDGQMTQNIKMSTDGACARFVISCDAVRANYEYRHDAVMLQVLCFPLLYFMLQNHVLAVSRNSGEG